MGLNLRTRLARWIVSWADEGPKAINTPYSNTARSSIAGYSVGSVQKTITSPCLSIKLYPGLGGMAIETHTYNRKNDSEQTTLHIIPEGVELGDALAKIITLDTMRME